MSAAANLKVASEATAHDLWRVAETGCPAELETILLRGVDVDATDDKGITALIRAACCGNSPVVHALLNHGANLNLTRSDGFTPLMLAAFYGHADVVSMLVERGADPSIGTRSRTSAAMWASARGFFRIAGIS
jgi:ankyrin repeat protein